MNFLFDNPKEIHIMVDLETLALTPDAAITEIGAIVIDRNVNKYVFFENTVDFDSDIDVNTVNWRIEKKLFWEGRDLTLEEAGNSPIHIKHVLKKFYAWIEEVKAVRSAETVIMWCKGTDFDSVILRTKNNCYALTPPWEYYNFHDMRTVTKLFPQFKIPRDTVRHTALDDVINQANALVAAADYLEGLECLYTVSQRNNK